MSGVVPIKRRTCALNPDCHAAEMTVHYCPVTAEQREQGLLAYIASAPDQRGRCATCDGHVHRKNSIAYPHEPTGPWLHVYEADWAHFPHNAVPRDWPEEEA